MFRHNYTMRIQNVKSGENLHRRLPQSRLIGRVQKYQVKLLSQSAQILHSIPLHHPGPVLKARDLQVLPNQLHCVGPPVYKDRGGRAPAEALNSQLARSGKEVQDPPALDVELYDVEDTLLNPIRGGTGFQTLQLF